MKKVLSLILVLILSLSFVSCNSKKDENSGKTVELTPEESFDQKLSALVGKDKEKTNIAENDLLAPAQNSAGVWGYINTKGQWVISPQYLSASSFSEGYATVLDEYYEYTIIDKTGEVVLSHFDRNSLSEVSYFNEGIIALSLDTIGLQKYTYANSAFQKDFTVRILPSVRSYSNYTYFGFASMYKNGLALVMRLKNSDITDKKGPETAYIISTSGAIVASLPEGLDPDVYGFDDQGNVVVSNTDRLYGLCDTTGAQLLECKYKRIIHCDGPLYLVCDESGFWGFIDETGTVVIDYKYQKAYPFSDGLAAVYDGTSWGFINEKGETAIEFMFDDVYPLNNSCKNSSLNKAVFNEGIAAVLRSNHWILIDTDANPIFALNMITYTEFSDCPFQSMGSGLISFAIEGSKGNNTGVVNKEGKIVIENGFLSIGQFR